MQELFPMIQPDPVATTSALLPYKEVAWDFEKGEPIFKNGSPLYVTGKDALKTWIWKALITPRGRYEIYSWNFGCDVESLIGQNFIAATKKAEATRYVREALEINPYIKGVSNVNVDFNGSTLLINVTVDTVYGEVEVNVRG